MKETVKFKRFLSLDDHEVLEKIHLNYRLSYLKDTALATGLDENNISTIVNLMSNNNSEVISNILLNQESIAKIFERLKNNDIEIRKEAINFLSEIFSISKNLQVQGRLNLLSSFKSIEEFNLSILVREWISLKNDLEAMEIKDASKIEEANKLINNSLDILLSYLQSFPVTLVDLCNDKTLDESEKLLRVLTEQLLLWSSQGIKLQIHEIIRFLLESDANITSTFYELGFKMFSEYFSKEYKENNSEYNESVDFSKSLAIDIINKAIVDDNYNAKMYIDRYNIIEGVNKLYNFKSKLLNIGIVKFHKSLIVTGFKPYITHMIKNNSLDNVIDIYEKNPNKRNMIGSIILEMFLMIEKKVHFELARHLWDKFESVHPFLKKFADQHQPKASFIDTTNQVKNDIKKQDELMFNGFDDSVEDEKANQEAFERSQLLCGKQREQEQKISFLNSLNSNMGADEEYSLVRQNVNRSPSSKIVIDHSFMKANGKSELDIDKNEEAKNKSVLGKYIIKILSKQTTIDEHFVYEPIEFTKGVSGFDLLDTKIYVADKQDAAFPLNSHSLSQDSIDESINEENSDTKPLKKRDEKQLRKDAEEKEANQQESSSDNDKEPNAQDFEIANAQENNGNFIIKSNSSKSDYIEQHKRFKAEEEEDANQQDEKQQDDKANESDKQGESTPHFQDDEESPDSNIPRVVEENETEK